MKPIILFLCGFFALYPLGAQDFDEEFEEEPAIDSVIVNLRGQVRLKSGGFEPYPKLLIDALDSTYEVTGDKLGKFNVWVILTYEYLSLSIYKEASEIAEEWSEYDYVPESDPLMITVKRIIPDKPYSKFIRTASTKY